MLPFEQKNVFSLRVSLSIDAEIELQLSAVNAETHTQGASGPTGPSQGGDSRMNSIKLVIMVSRLSPALPGFACSFGGGPGS